jgi:hypothetical protein
MCRTDIQALAPWGELILTCDRSDELQRYEIRRDGPDRWTIVDTLTSLPAASNGRDLIGLTQVDARDIADELNRSLAEGRDPLI